MEIAHRHTTQCPYCQNDNEHNYFCDQAKNYTIQFVSCQNCNNAYAVSIAFHSEVSAIWKLELVNNFLGDNNIKL
jgi:transcription elongation factor Elf1